jgi:hypothetical protein
MSWHVIARVGMSDTYDGDLPRDEPRIFAAIARSGDRWTIGNDVYPVIFARTGRFPSPLATDLLHLAFAVYSADLQIQRSFFDDRWTRDLVVHLPVSDPDRWTELAPLISRMLAYLTGDVWEIRARRMESFAHPKPERPKPATLQRSVHRVSLFSGGLDSLVGAIDLLEQGETVALVGHHGAGMANLFQQNVLKVLRAAYGDLAPEFMFFVQPPKDHRDGEPSMRSRSLLFFSLGIGVASTLGAEQPLVVAENGLISLNVPLTNPRMGSLSTRTTHPHFVALFRDLLRGLGIVAEIQTPYRFQTKGEMLGNVRNATVLAQTAKESMSCSHTEAGRYQGRTPGNHCGYCVPCIIRRASMLAAGVADAGYDFDVLTDAPDASLGTGADLRAFQMALERFVEAKPHEALFRVLGTGPLPPNDAKDYAAVYSRGMDEVGRLLMPGRFNGDPVT